MSLTHCHTPGRVIAGAYPASLDDAETHQLLSLLLELGVNTFVCLQAEVNIHIPGDTCVQQQHTSMAVARQYGSCGTVCAVPPVQAVRCMSVMQCGACVWVSSC
jgi:hypothetical protein